MQEMDYTGNSIWVRECGPCPGTPTGYRAAPRPRLLRMLTMRWEVHVQHGRARAISEHTVSNMSGAPPTCGFPTMWRAPIAPLMSIITMVHMILVSMCIGRGTIMIQLPFQCATSIDHINNSHYATCFCNLRIHARFARLVRTPFILGEHCSIRLHLSS